MMTANRRCHAGFQLAVAVLFLHGLARAGSATPQARGLSLTQIEKLIQIRTPDAAVAQEIRSRGLDFTPTPKILDELQRRGAGQATLAVVRERMPIGTLEIQAPPGSQVAVDGTDRGTTNTQGRLVLSDLPAGPHRLFLKKEGYLPGDFKLTLAAREYKRFSAQLDWAGGFLTVRSDPPGASIEISGLGQFNDGASELQCSPGTYDIKVTRTGMKPDSRSVVVAAGQHATVDVHLILDPERLRNEIMDARVQLAGGNTARAIQIANDVVALDASNSEARSLLAGAYFQSRDLPHFTTAANEALDHGGSVQVDLMHYHAFPRSVHPITLMLAAKTIAYDPQPTRGSSCSYRAFNAPVENIQSVQTTRDDAGQIFLLLKLRDPSHPSKTMTLNFAELGSQIGRRYAASVDLTVNAVVSPGDAPQVLNAVLTVIRHTLPGGH